MATNQGGRPIVNRDNRSPKSTPIVRTTSSRPGVGATTVKGSNPVSRKNDPKIGGN